MVLQQKTHLLSRFIFTIGGVVLFASSACLAAETKSTSTNQDFKKAKTFFQVNLPYHPGIDLPVDAVVIHPHSDTREALTEQFTTWHRLGIPIGRMLFADSDNDNRYWTGKWDGKDHRQDTEIDKNGNVILCAGVRPYMLPTQGWTDFLKEKVAWSLDVGVEAILPEEPLAHVHSGYEESFKEIWETYYHSKWQPLSDSPLAHYRTNRLKSQLYWELEQTLAEQTYQASLAQEKPIRFVLPIHSLYSTIASGLVAPLGTSGSMKHVDGYVGQIWTGPVRWTLAQYPSPEKSFFGSAFALYDYFCQLTTGTDKKLWLLVDPLEDDLNHQWHEFAEWYRHCTVAMLLMREVDSYEVMPWPERIFLRRDANGDNAIPNEFLTLTLSITQVLQIPRGGTWLGECMDSGIGIAVADSAMWQAQAHEVLKSFYSPLMPLLRRGIPVSSVVLERASDEKYMDQFKIILVSFEGFKPYDEKMCDGLVRWVKQGGCLLILRKEPDPLDREKTFWWQEQGHASATEALLDKLGNRQGVLKEWQVEKGHLFLFEGITPSDFSDPQNAQNQYLPLLKKAAEKAKCPQVLQETGYFCMKRGDFVIAHAETKPLKIKGKYVDLFSKDFTLHDEIDLKPGDSGLYKDVLDAFENATSPQVLHTTYRLISQTATKPQLCFTVRGPEATEMTALVFVGQQKVTSVSAVSGDHKELTPQWNVQNETLLIRLPNQPSGVEVTIKLASPHGDPSVSFPPSPEIFSVLQD